jgi:hypothetical protein
MIFLLAITCQEESIEHYTDQNKSADGFIIGFDPCTINHNYGTGYVIITTDFKDTLVTYNFPDTIFYFPPEYFQNYRSSAYFPDSALDDFRTKIIYRKAKENELNVNACTHDINQSDFYRQFDNNQVIIISATKF